MKITFILTWADALSGTERTILTQAEHLAPRHDVQVLSVFRTKPPEEGFAAAVRERRLSVRYLVDRTGDAPRPERRGPGYDDAACRRLSVLSSMLADPTWEREFTRMTDIEMEHALRGLDADIALTTSPALLAQVTALVPERVITVHQEHRISERRGPTGAPLYDRVPRLDALVTLNSRTRDWFAATFGPAAPRLAAIPNALPPGFRPASVLNSRTIVMAGRLVPEKQADHAVRAFATLIDDHPDWVLRIFGDGPGAARLRMLVSALGLHDSVQLLGRTPDMAEEWAKAAVAVLPSRVEAFPLVTMEAMAAGVPVVAYDCPNGPGEMITDGLDGVLVAPDDIVGLATALRTLMGDDTVRHTLGTAARRSADRYTIEKVMPRWEALYADLLRERDESGRTARRTDRVAAWIARTAGTGFAPATPLPDAPASARETRSLERRMRAADSTLVRSGGRMCRVSDRLLPPQLVDACLELVADALEDGRVPYLLLRDHGIRHRVAVEAPHREAALAALARHCADRPVYAEILHPGGRPGRAVPVAVLPSLADGVAGLRVFQPTVTTSRTLRYGPAYGCDLEFWSESPSGDALVPLRPTLIGDVVPRSVLEPAHVCVAGRSHPSIRAFTRPLVSDVAFPIDAVYTWVDGADPRWRARRDAALDGRDAEEGAAGDDRFRSRDELRYSLRSLAMFAPWIRHVWIVTDGQVPEWLNTGYPKITLVDHREIFAGRGRLPTFNSHAIETQLHHIDGLSEHFLYLNDDIFIGRPVHPAQFFRPNGTANFFLSPTPVPLSPICEDDDFNFAAAKNNRRLIEATFGRTLTHSFLHAPHPLRRDVLKEIEERFAVEVARTAATPLRSRTDVSVPSSLHHYYGYLTERSTPGSIRAGYVNLNDRSQHPKLTRFLTMRDHDVLCLNDTCHGDADPAELDLIVAAFLQSYFPVPSEFD
ncbi:stealth conserved region 3 domain-containing protein [Actinomadura madurae]|uniref:stealth conserved region 3 domain-containing protein n=1 Tax=Actinomadura madurae TaxID=1993 RepID=UPI000DA0860B|nr:stealth conserved region 3 domain-containing protein [Actinomadura madurae]SPT51134.1 Capsular polysaccharide phosphotransferase SacB [Actinomadura madurae]